MAWRSDEDGASNKSRRSPPRPARTAGEISKEVLSDAIQNSTTIYPLGLAMTACMFTFFISPFIGGTLVGIALAVLAGLTAAGSFFYHYVLRGNEYAEQKAQEDIERVSHEQREYQQAATDSLYDEVEGGFRANRSTYASDGLMALRDLTLQYQRVVDSISQHSEDDSVLSASMDNLSSLTRDTYMQGMNALRDAIDIMQGGRIQAAKIKELFAKCNECQEALQHVSDELINSHISETQASVDSATESLRTTIDVARKVERRLSGEDQREEDERYLRAGQQQDERTH